MVRSGYFVGHLMGCWNGANLSVPFSLYPIVALAKLSSTFFCCCSLLTCGCCASMSPRFTKKRAQITYCCIFGASLVLYWILREVATPFLEKFICNISIRILSFCFLVKFIYLCRISFGHLFPLVWPENCLTLILFPLPTFMVSFVHGLWDFVFP